MIYNYNTFLKTLSISDKSIKILSIDGAIKYSINPFSIINIRVSNNLLQVSLKNDKLITLDFHQV
jgi:hypothetical protein